MQGIQSLCDLLEVPNSGIQLVDLKNNRLTAERKLDRFRNFSRLLIAGADAKEQRESSVIESEVERDRGTRGLADFRGNQIEQEH